MTTRVVEIAVHFAGDGTVRRVGEGGFVGGVVPPTLGSDVGYLLHRTTADSDGLLGPEPGEAGVLGSFQLNLIGTARGFRELGRYFLALAELDSSADPGHHQHFDDVRSTDGRTVVEVVIRKEPDRDGEPV